MSAFLAQYALILDGNHFTLEFPYCNGDCFEQYLEAFSEHRPSEFKILLLDNGAFHKAKDLIIPDNIVLLFLPPYCPELNPAEKMWRHIKDKLANIIFDSLEKLSDKVCQLVKELRPETYCLLLDGNYINIALNRCLIGIISYT